MRFIRLYNNEFFDKHLNHLNLKIMSLVKNLTVKVIILMLMAIPTMYCQDSTQSIQINLEGINLDKFLIEVDGNKVLLNGMKPEDAGVKLNLVRKKEGQNSMTVAEYGLELKQPVQEKPVYTGTPYMGIVTVEKEDGLQIIEINSLGPARRARLRLGDIIYKIDDKKVLTHEALMAVILTKNPGQMITINLRRGSRELTNQMELMSKTSVVRGGMKKDPKLIKYERPKSLGIKIREGKDKKSWRVIEVKPNSAAEDAGLLVNDNIFEINGRKVTSAQVIDEVMKSASQDEPVIIKVKRAGAEKVLKIK